MIYDTRPADVSIYYDLSLTLCDKKLVAPSWKCLIQEGYILIYNLTHDLLSKSLNKWII